MIDLKFSRRRRVIDRLRETYPGKWVYEWPWWRHEDGSYVARVAILGGWNGDDVVGSSLYHYFPDGRPTKAVY